MILSVVKRGKILETVPFWSEKDSLETARVAVLVGANGSGKSATIESIYAWYDLHDRNTSSDGFTGSAHVRRETGAISTDPRFDVVYRYKGVLGNNLPGGVYSDEDFTRCVLSKKSHGEAGLLLLRNDLPKLWSKVANEDMSALLLLDEIEDGLSAEAQTIVANSIVRNMTSNPRVSAVVATQSDRVRREFLSSGFGVEIDFGGWIFGNPWKE